jgi:hypothetical protein
VLGVLEPLVDPLLEPWLEIFVQPRPRAVPRVDPNAPSPFIHKSVYDRRQHPPITGGRYRSTRALAPGQTETVEVFARKRWNETGLYLEAGEYRFTVRGEWLDSDIPSGPAGTTGLRRFDPLIEKGRLVGTLFGQGERLFRFVTGNKDADFVFSRREEDMPWMSLVGVVANDAIPIEGARNAHERIAIGDGTYHRVTKSGYLYAFANDAWGSYVDNQGSVRLTVTRLSDEARERSGSHAGPDSTSPRPGRAGPGR